MFTLMIGGKGDNRPPVATPDAPKVTARRGPVTNDDWARLWRSLTAAVEKTPRAFDVIQHVVDDINADEGATSLARHFAGDWRSDMGLLSVLSHWAALRKSDRYHVGNFAAALSNADHHTLRSTLEHLANRFKREQLAELAAVLQRLSLGQVCKASTNDDSRMARSQTIANTFDTLTDQQQTDVAAIVVALAQRNAGCETRNTAMTVRANVLRFIRHVFGAADLGKIVKGCIDTIAGNTSNATDAPNPERQE